MTRALFKGPFLYISVDETYGADPEKRELGFHYKC
jgi:hypothetical protein